MTLVWRLIKSVVGHRDLSAVGETLRALTLLGSQLAQVLAGAAATLIPAASREAVEKTRNDKLW